MKSLITDSNRTSEKYQIYNDESINQEDSMQLRALITDVTTKIIWFKSFANSLPEGGE